MENDWKEPYEDDGVTLGPEEALRRETEKTKALKVERLQLKDSIEKLQAENASLDQANQPPTQKMDTPVGGETTGDSASPTGPGAPLIRPMPTRWVFFILAFNLAVAGMIVFFFIK